MCITLYFAKLQKILIKDKSAHSFYREKFFMAKNHHSIIFAFNITVTLSITETYKNVDRM